MTDKQQLNQLGNTLTPIGRTELQPGYIRQGWQCPKCGRILSPDTTFCPFCSGGSSYTINGQTYGVVAPNIGQLGVNE